MSERSTPARAALKRAGETGHGAQDGVGETGRRPRLYGRRGRIGLIVPATNSTSEAEFALYSPDGVSIHTTRAPAALATDPAALLAEVIDCAKLLLPAGCDLIAFGSLEATLGEAGSTLSHGAQAVLGVPVLTAGGAVLGALQVLAAQRIAILAPHDETATRGLVDRFTRLGFAVAASKGLGVADGPSEQGRISGIPRTVVMSGVADLIAGAGPIDALVVASTDLPTIDLVAVMEDAYGMPVITANQALLWLALRTLGLDEINLSLGELFLKSVSR